MAIKLKKAYEGAVVGFNNSALPLGQRYDLHLLVQLGKTHNDQSILVMFEEVPDDQEIVVLKEQAFLDKQSKKAAAQEPADTEKQ
ncbi:hypothetical protein [Deminuibacter soli]|uniref:Uncharacterized protein n=1 Tax=Deminuibacter soli TaxID=2291815 RepID=A0A3E1NQ23_9BACT|nr:hypothetical protein [Deminuibacter soli]RFM30023.1 hypothetical protein DXN05_03360 [Deminuibacter soli]